MFTVIEKNRKTQAILSTTSFPNEKDANKYAIRCTLCQNNPNIVYNVE